MNWKYSNFLDLDHKANWPRKNYRREVQYVYILKPKQQIYLWQQKCNWTWKAGIKRSSELNLKNNTRREGRRKGGREERGRERKLYKFNSNWSSSPDSGWRHFLNISWTQRLNSPEGQVSSAKQIKSQISLTIIIPRWGKGKNGLMFSVYPWMAQRSVWLWILLRIVLV